MVFRISALFCRLRKALLSLIFGHLLSQEFVDLIRLTVSTL